MHLRLTEYVLWISSFFLLIPILLVMYRRGMQRSYPFFFAYLLLEITSCVMLFAVRSSYTYYFYNYWAEAAMDSLLVSAALAEIVWIVLHRNAPRKGKTYILAAVVAMILLATVSIVWSLAFPENHSGFNTFIDTVIHSNRIARYAAIALLVLLTLFHKALRTSRRDTVFGIALGFGVYALTTVLTSIAQRSPSIFSRLSLRTFSSGSYDAALLIWLVYMIAAPRLSISSHNS